MFYSHDGKYTSIVAVMVAAIRKLPLTLRVSLVICTLNALKNKIVAMGFRYLLQQ